MTQHVLQIVCSIGWTIHYTLHVIFRQLFMQDDMWLYLKGEIADKDIDLLANEL